MVRRTSDVVTAPCSRRTYGALCRCRRTTPGPPTRGRWSRSAVPMRRTSWSGRPRPVRWGAWPWASTAAGAHPDRVGPGRRAAGRGGEPRPTGGARGRPAPRDGRACGSRWASTPCRDTARRGSPPAASPRRRRSRLARATGRRPSSSGRPTRGSSWPATGVGASTRMGGVTAVTRQRSAHGLTVALPGIGGIYVRQT